MPPRPADVLTKFQAELSACRVVYQQCVGALPELRTAGTEAAFLRAFQSLEALLEDSFVAFLTGEPDCKGRRIPVQMQAVSEESCRVILNGGRAFAGWADPDEVAKRIEVFFGPGQMLSDYRAAKSELAEAKVCRNAIAHSSGSAQRQLEALWMQKQGTAKSGLRTVDLLTLTYAPNPPKVFFDRYLDVMEAMAANICDRA